MTMIQVKTIVNLFPLITSKTDRFTNSYMFPLMTVRKPFLTVVKSLIYHSVCCYLHIPSLIVLLKFVSNII